MFSLSISNSKKRIFLSLDKEQIKLMDRVSHSLGITKSELISEMFDSFYSEFVSKKNKK